MKVLITGVAGFIGYHLAERLVDRGYTVVGLDNLNHYYDVRLKLDRLANLGIPAVEIALGQAAVRSKRSDFVFVKADLADAALVQRLFEQERFDAVFNLAAQAGVRYSLKNPQAYVSSNLVGFANLLEACRHHRVGHLIYASSSSVYGLQDTVPYRVDDPTNRPISLYAASKRSNELMAHAYSHLFGLPCTGLRFFTVYGTWGRPDMATMLFADAIQHQRPIRVFNHGQMSRDFTYVGDIVDGLERVLQRPPRPADEGIPYRLYNIGSHRPVRLLTFIEALETAFGKQTEKVMLPLQEGDMVNTYADISQFVTDFDYTPDTPLADGLAEFVEWYRAYYGPGVPLRTPLAL